MLISFFMMERYFHRVQANGGALLHFPGNTWLKQELDGIREVKGCLHQVVSLESTAKDSEKPSVTCEGSADDEKRHSEGANKKAILMVVTKIAKVAGPPTTPFDFVDIIKNITQLEAAFTEEAIVRMNQNFMETLI
uniref:Uncharacterized protein n=1 Tax=Chromera velia CCMP2878 TaxID=1169474 RepID=A0A0G4GCJ1_9ALVE|eukprot:Cvel_21290.t1-p1 / transcript=Cvel_21290.t1 / gene=Cvel_21290 / organism=Chromera_velia_CCMP2878 / gene_product=hypothetical protein / transcript_product=hypothetical protein / location=Cvel_scaffold1983:247-3267(-) / protein_length=135 / sequence_SO=supercontig / SO=protein_coding / is_pseudo=false